MAAQVRPSQGASLQNYNNQLVAYLESIKEQRSAVEKEIQADMMEKSQIERQIAVLTEKLTQVNGDFLIRKFTQKDRLAQQLRQSYSRNWRGLF